ncbi:MAG: LarC family nickel insertion protein [Deferribacteraceae bacterium]|jgi:uncharacterized protein (DUF111 family)|nr:LarC family nickel insertion protein [Deferribacteraceae bacterium]
MKKPESDRNVILIECNIDDMSGEFFGDVMGRLFAVGALDVWFTSAYGKKNRPLYQLSALVKPADEEAALREIFANTSTAGIRRQLMDRIVMDRSFVNVKLEGSTIKVKKLTWKDIVKYTPEWDDCAAVSRAANRPAAEIYALAQTLAQKTDQR